jgi:CheY-like chemotaxis protein
MDNPSILIVEDDSDVAELYSRVLAPSGLTIEIIRTGEAALARLAATVPAVVVLDLNLPPQVSGSDVFHHIRSDPRLAATRVIVVTGHPDLADAVRDQADLVLIKPVDVNQLSDFVMRLRPGH